MTCFILGIVEKFSENYRTKPKILCYSYLTGIFVQTRKFTFKIEHSNETIMNYRSVLIWGKVLYRSETKY